ncbi:MULTIPLE ORGANELLAR RNA EDITING FACTOR 2 CHLOROPLASTIC-RELATED-RELATED [Salix koriyanagi]|uniref:MULTIPLE ORGANELLAR RNA EDITING FACTOR 2 CHLOROPLASTIC-RELATED-RELATED n=1 Tax=Salix koriyanagi TaxID=2511006 RepID=A0A9Q0WMJ2_9ROSI|nr:MULTIPLE ORGANELLAR RNA EDITING FACTOR 2 CHLOROPLASTIC-RELATED-RELATED [Salix koriyanagi]
MTPTLARSLTTRHLNLCVLLPKRLLSTISITHLPTPPTLLCRQSLPSLSHDLQSINKTANPAARFTSISCRVNRAGNSGYSPLNSGSNFSDRPPNEMAPLFPGCDYEHWLILLAVRRKQRRKIYNVSCERYFGFGCEIDEETSNKLEGLPGVLFVLPDSYVDPEYKDYGAELFVNGEIVQRPPERQRRVEPQPQRANDRPRYNDRTRYVRRRENMR